MTTERTIAELKSRYRAGPDRLGDDFFAICLNQAIEYKRAAGFFSSSALITWADALPRLMVDRNTTIKLLISPKLSELDAKAIIRATSDSEKQQFIESAIDDYFEKAIAFSKETSNVELRLELFGWMVANRKLEIRFALVEHEADLGMYHEKFGVFVFDGSKRVGFIGSANESLSGHRANGEFVMVFRSWCEGDKARIEELDAEFQDAWEGRLPGTSIYRPSPALIEKLAAGVNPGSIDRPVASPTTRPPPWPHQANAIDAFLLAKKGILEMATGTGKTRTALEIALRLVESESVTSVVITTDGNDLLEQWYRETLVWKGTDQCWRRVFRHFGGRKERDLFVFNPNRSCIVISRGELGKVLDGLSDQAKGELLVIHDEVHGLGAPQKISELSGKHNSVGWVLGLSATPEREYDEEGNVLINQEVGPVVFQYSLEDAIRDSILCPFDYTALSYELTEGDKRRFQKVWSKKAARAKEGRPMSPEEVAIELSRVYKTAELKPIEFDRYVDKHPTCLKNCIIFVETKEYGEAVMPTVHRHTLGYKTYYADDEKTHLERFANGELDCLITCHKLSQGIDIPHLENVVLFSSAKSKLETIQRIGRCLRIDRENPDKIAHVIDFELLQEENEKDEASSDPDAERVEWLSAVARIRPER